MTDDPRRRALMRQGFLFLLIALVLGLAVIALPHPSRWLAGQLTDLPGPTSNPGVAMPMPPAAVFLVILAIIVPCLFVSFGLVFHGMRGAAAEH